MKNTILTLQEMTDEAIGNAVNIVKTDLKQNKIVCIIGSSGTGKTTIARRALGLKPQPIAPNELKEAPLGRIINPTNRVIPVSAIHKENDAALFIDEIAYFMQNEDTLNIIKKSQFNGKPVVITAQSGKDISRMILDLPNVSIMTVRRSPQALGRN